MLDVIAVWLAINGGYGNLNDATSCVIVKFRSEKKCEGKGSDAVD